MLLCFLWCVLCVFPCFLGLCCLCFPLFGLSMFYPVFSLQSPLFSLSYSLVFNVLLSCLLCLTPLSSVSCFLGCLFLAPLVVSVLLHWLSLSSPSCRAAQLPGCPVQEFFYCGKDNFIMSQSERRQHVSLSKCTCCKTSLQSHAKHRISHQRRRKRRMPGRT